MILIERRFCTACDLPKVVTHTEVSTGDTPDMLTLECGHAIPADQPLTPLCGLGRTIGEEFIQMTTRECESLVEHGFATSFKKARHAGQ